MSVSIKIAGASFAKSVSRIAPQFKHASLLMLFGGSEAESKVNLITGQNTTLIGTPTYGDGYADVGGQSGFDSGIVSLSNSWTHCVIATVGAGNGIYMGNWTGADNDTAVGRFNTSIYPFVGGTTRGTGTPYASASGFNFMAASHNGATAKVHAANAGVVNSASAALGAEAVTAPLRVGGLIGVAGTNNRVAAAMSFNVALTDAQVLEVHDYLKYLVGKRGIVVA